MALVLSEAADCDEQYMVSDVDLQGPELSDLLKQSIQSQQWRVLLSVSLLSRFV